MILNTQGKTSVYLLVPIRVGMILLAFENIRGSFTCPHTRGDDPLAL